MKVVEYRIPMPLEVKEYKVGQLYMISRHTVEQVEKGTMVDVIANEPCESPENGPGQYTEKNIHLQSRLPAWLTSILPKVFYITERAWNHYPYTITRHTCSFVPGFSVEIETFFANDSGKDGTDHHFTPEEDKELRAKHQAKWNEKNPDRTVVHIDIVNDAPYRESMAKTDPSLKDFTCEKVNRGPWEGNTWMDGTEPIMCSYKCVSVIFSWWGFQTRVEDLIHSVVQDVLLLGHRQAVAWMNEWIEMSVEDVRQYEKDMIAKIEAEKAAAQAAAQAAALEGTQARTSTEPAPQ
eukprot:Clim_evm35s240 gene=Clim_evmTU35s240